MQEVINTDSCAITYLNRTDHCPDCGKDTGQAFMMGNISSNPRCTPCNEKAYAKFLQSKGETSEDDRFTTINEVIPPKFRNRDAEWLRKVQPALNPVLDWRPNREGRGVILEGPADAGKTTSLYMLMEELILSKGYKPAVTTAVMLGMDVTASYGNTKRNAKEVLEHYGYVSVLVIDDLGKEVIKDRFAEALFEILNIRGNYCRPTFVTTQLSPSKMGLRFEGKTEPEALMKRIYGDMDRIHLTQKLPRYEKQEEFAT